jgi:hypothetical protein
MKRIRITESDLQRIVKRVISEQPEGNRGNIPEDSMVLYRLESGSQMFDVLGIEPDHDDMDGEELNKFLMAVKGMTLWEYANFSSPEDPVSKFYQVKEVILSDRYLKQHPAVPKKRTNYIPPWRR